MLAGRRHGMLRADHHAARIPAVIQRGAPMSAMPARVRAISNSSSSRFSTLTCAVSPRPMARFTRRPRARRRRAGPRSGRRRSARRRGAPRAPRRASAASRTPRARFTVCSRRADRPLAVGRLTRRDDARRHERVAPPPNVHSAAVRHSTSDSMPLLSRPGTLRRWPHVWRAGIRPHGSITCAVRARRADRDVHDRRRDAIAEHRHAPEQRRRRREVDAALDPAQPLGVELARCPPSRCRGSRTAEVQLVHARRAERVVRAGAPAEPLRHLPARPERLGELRRGAVAEGGIGERRCRRRCRAARGRRSRSRRGRRARSPPGARRHRGPPRPGRTRRRCAACPARCGRASGDRPRT